MMMTAVTAPSLHRRLPAALLCAVLAVVSVLAFHEPASAVFPDPAMEVADERGDGKPARLDAVAASLARSSGETDRAFAMVRFSQRVEQLLQPGDVFEWRADADGDGVADLIVDYLRSYETEIEYPGFGWGPPPKWRTGVRRADGSEPCPHGSRFPPLQPVGEYRIELAPECFDGATRFRWQLVTGTTSDGTTVKVADRIPNSGWSDWVPAPVERQIPDNGVLNPVAPVRVLDTRAYAGGRLSPGGTTTIDVGQMLSVLYGVPSGAAAGAVLNVTAVAPDAAGHLTVYPCDDVRDRPPSTSNLNFTVPGVVVANAVVVPVSSSGKVCVHSPVSAVDVVADITGWIPDGSPVKTLTPFRLADTRAGTHTDDGRERAGGRVAGGRSLAVQVTGRAGVPAAATAAIVNVTAVTPAGFGHLTVHPCGSKVPLASNLNYTPGSVVAGTAIVTLDRSGRICVATAADADLVVDITGYATRSSKLTALTPARLADTRPGSATVDGVHSAAGRLRAGETREFRVAGRGGVDSSAAGVLLNVTAVTPDAPGYLTVFPCGAAPPVASNLNYTPGSVVANAVVVPVSSSGKVCVHSSAASDVLVDLAGWLAS